MNKSGYCATKNLYNYGVKLHVLESYQIGSMPIPERIGLTHAGVNDGKAYLANQHVHTYKIKKRADILRCGNRWNQ